MGRKRVPPAIREELRQMDAAAAKGKRKLREAAERQALLDIAPVTVALPGVLPR